MRWGQVVVGLAVLVATAWGCLALWFQLPRQFSALGLIVLGIGGQLFTQALK